MKNRVLKILLLFICLYSTAYADNNKTESNGTIVYKNSQISSKVVASQIAVNQNYVITGPVAAFDILIDEKLDENDPRIKSIIYVAKQNLANSVLISYTNPNATELAQRILSIMNRYSIQTNRPELVVSQNKEDLKLVVVKIKYIVHHKLNTSTPVEFQNK